MTTHAEKPTTSRYRAVRGGPKTSRVLYVFLLLFGLAGFAGVWLANS